MEFAAGGDILKVVKQHQRARTYFPEEEIWRALGNMAKGLKCLHDNKILHRDLKCANVFISSDGNYKLGDLNVSKVLKMGLAHTQTGTPYYASP
jgi:NIMA (never in mitosis gene a)-related kinase